MTTRKQPIGILGGTFDPVHFGHLRSAIELVQDLDLQEVRLIPCARPPHRSQPRVSAEQRRVMLELAVAKESSLSIDDRELRREALSYTVDTLASLRAELRETPLCLIVGMDAFVGLPSWHRWRDLFELSHIVVLQRPGWRSPIEGPLAALTEARTTTHPDALHNSRAGYVLFWSVTQLAISSTSIRAQLAEGANVRYLLPETVYEHIYKEGLY